MNTFSLKRCLQLIKLDLVSNYLKYCTIFLLIVLINIFIMCIQIKPNNFSVLSLNIQILGFYLLFTASYSMNVLSSKKKRLEYLMIPANNLEKYISRLLIAILFSILLYCCAFFTADYLQLLSKGNFIPSAENSVFLMSLEEIRGNLSGLEMIRNVSPLTNLNDSGFIFSLLFILTSTLIWSYSLFLLAGNYFRKNPFVKAFIIHGIMCFVFVKIIISIFTNWIKNLNFINLIGSEEGIASINETLQITGSIFLLISLIFFWASYRLFTHTQIIENKNIIAWISKK